MIAGLLRELAAGLASKLACHLFSMAMIVLGITPLNRKENKGKKMREPLMVFYITAATVHQISMLAFLMFQSSAFDKGIYCTYILSHSYFILEYFV